MIPALLDAGSVFPGGSRERFMVGASCSATRVQRWGRPVCRCTDAPFCLLGATLLHRDRPSLQCSGRVSFPNRRSRFLISTLPSLFSFSPTRNRAVLDWLFWSLEAQGRQGMSDGCLHEVGRARWLLERKKEERVLGGKVWHSKSECRFGPNWNLF